MAKPAINPSIAAILSVAVAGILLFLISLLPGVSPAFVFGVAVGVLVGTWAWHVWRRFKA